MLTGLEIEYHLSLYIHVLYAKVAAVLYKRAEWG